MIGDFLPKADELLSREEFRRLVFARDRGVCVVCGQMAVDAHHIMERKLWEDGGYYLGNGVALCATHHIDAESTMLSCGYLRDCAHIGSVMLPPHLDKGSEYDKWGNILVDNSTRIRGELFDESRIHILP